MADDRNDSEEKRLVFAVAGGGNVTYETVEDLLLNWVGEREMKAYLPADRTTTSAAVCHVADWLMEIDEPYDAIVTPTPGRKGEGIAEDAETHHETDDAAAKIISILGQAKADGDEAVLLLAWGEDPATAPDAITGQLLDAALAAEITVLDLTMGLEDLGYAEEVPEGEEPPNEEDAEEDAPAEPEVTGELTETEVELAADPEAEAAERMARIKTKYEKVRELVDKAEGIKPADEAQATLPPAVEPQETVPDLATVLAFVYQRLDCEDRANAANQMQPHYSRPLTRAVKHHLRTLVEDAAVAVEKVREAKREVQEALQQPAEGAPRRRGKPRDIAADVVVVLHDPAKRTVRLLERPGRPRKGETREEMSRAAYEALSADYGVDD
ncbi:hypothetical protein ACWDTT_10495 [Streptosporangium sandarakinum]